MTAVILGGGISGLASAYYLIRNSSSFKRIVLLEASDRLGGWIQTTRFDNGSLFEHGPRSFRVKAKAASSNNTLSLAAELGLSSDIISVTKDHPSSKNRYIYVNKKIHKVPSDTKSFVFKQPPFTRSMMRVMFVELFAPSQQNDDESIESFFTRRLGSEFTDYFMNPFMRGIYAGDISKLSVKSCLPFELLRLEKEHGSIFRGLYSERKNKPVDTEVYVLQNIERAEKEKWVAWSLKNGLSALTERIEDIVTRCGVEIIKSTPCRKLEFNDNGVKVITDSESFDADHVVSSVFSQNLASLVDEQHPELSHYLNQIPAVSCIVVNVEFRNYTPKNEGFGHLVPSFEDPCVLGIIYDSSTFKQHDSANYISTRYTVMLGGAWYDQLVDRLGNLKESTVEDFAVKVLKEQLNIDQDPSNVIVKYHKDCIPQYYVGHSKIVESLDKYVEDHKLPMTLVGSSYNGVGLIDCIYKAKLALKQFDNGLQKIIPENSNEQIQQAS